MMIDSIFSLIFPIHGLNKLNPAAEIHPNEHHLISKTMVLLGEDSM